MLSIDKYFFYDILFLVIILKIYVDADACPVKNIIIEEAKKRNISVIMICDTSHIISDGYSSVITVDTQSDSADLFLANKITSCDIAVTQDYGLAALVCGKGAKCINQNGIVYDNTNIDRLLFERFLSGKIRRSGNKTKGPSKREKKNDEDFRNQFVKLLDEGNR